MAYLVVVVAGILVLLADDETLLMTDVDELTELAVGPWQLVTPELM